MYRILIRRKTCYGISHFFFGRLFDFILSLRQKLLLEGLCPFVVLAIPLMIKFFQQLSV